MVIYMLKRILLCVFAVVQFMCANLSYGYRVSVDGKELPGTFSRKELRRAGIVSCAAVDEIARGNSVPSECGTVPVFGLRLPEGNAKMLCDILVTSAPGVARYCEIYVGDQRCGIVSDPAEFQNEAVPVFSGTLYRPVYSYEGRPSDYAAACSAVKQAILKLT